MEGRKLVTFETEKSHQKVFRGWTGCYRFLRVPLHPPSVSENMSLGRKGLGHVLPSCLSPQRPDIGENSGLLTTQHPLLRAAIPGGSP